MKKTSFFRSILCAVLALVLMAVPAYADDTQVNMAVTQGCSTLDGEKPLLDPDAALAETASAMLYDVNTDTLLYSVNPDLPQYPAGLVKVMTALIVAEQASLSDNVTIRQETLDALPYGTKSLDLQAGEVIPMQEILYAILVEGANEAALIAAEHLYGNQESFVQEMNAYAAELGCTNTHFVNVHGLHDDQQITTARDMVKILSAALQNEVFTEAFSTYAYRMAATNKAESRLLSSGSFIFNRNLGSNHFDNRVTGSRTGTTATAVRNLIVTAEQNDQKLISIVLGSTSEINPDGSTGFYKEIRTLLDKGFNNMESVQVFYDNLVVTQFDVKNGDSAVSVCAKEEFSTTVPKNITNWDLTYRYEMVQSEIVAPVTAGDKICNVQIWYEDTCLAQADLYALHDVGVQEFIATEEYAEETESGAMAILTIMGIIVGLLILLLFGRPLIFRMIRRQQIRRRKKSSRRRR